ncbi:MAG: group 1 glycosyl transferase [Parcubacteria group bacterium Gr01-1014_107]|nr:MAG: group 1 glycosyl transferase [Parcubacteria group bacterium Gr01-1014_107]
MLEKTIGGIILQKSSKKSKGSVIGYLDKTIETDLPTSMDNKERKIKILYIITKGNWGGAQRYVYDLATSLPKDQFDIAVAFGEGETLKKKLEEGAIRTIRLKHSQRNINFLEDFGLLFELFKLYVRERPDIIHLNSSKIGLLGTMSARFYFFLHFKLLPAQAGYTLSRSASGGRLGKRFGKAESALALNPKIIFTAHGWAFNESRSFFKKSLLKLGQWLTVLLADKIIAVSQKTREDMIYLPFVGRKIETIHNGVENIEFLPKEEARRSLWKEAKEGLWIGTIAELHRNKGVDILIEAFEQITKENLGVKLLIIGEGEERNFLEKKIKERGLVGSVLLKGFLESASKYLKALDIFVLASRTEGLPYTLLEAGLAGLPVIGNKVGGIAEIIEDGVTGLVAERGNVESIKDSLRYLLANKKLGEILGQNLKRKVDRKFTLKELVCRTLLVYNTNNE